MIPDANVLFAWAGNVMTMVSPTEYAASPSSGSSATAEEISDAAYALDASSGTTPTLKIITTIITNCILMKFNTLHLSLTYNSSSMFRLHNLTYDCIQMHVKENIETS